MDSFEEGYAADGGSADEVIHSTTPPPYNDGGRYDFNAPPSTMTENEGYGGSPPRSMDDFSVPMDNDNGDNNMQSSENFGLNSPPAGNPEYAPSPFESNGDRKGYDMGTDTEGIFSSAPSDGPLLPDPTEMREEGAAFREWRRTGKMQFISRRRRRRRRKCKTR